MLSIRRIGVIAAVVLLAPWAASAQTIGTFRWQTQPFCNVITLTVEQKVGVFTLSGFDDLCGAPRRAPASGTAQPNPDGTVGIGVTVLRPDGIAVHHTVALNLVTLGGPWFDNYGNTGAFTFNVSSPASGSPRPVTVRGTYGIEFTAPAKGYSGMSSVSFGLTLQAVPQAHFIGNGRSDPACSGTSAAPQAAPGHLCVYASLHNEFEPPLILDLGTTGANVYMLSDCFCETTSRGTWAVTVP